MDASSLIPQNNLGTMVDMMMMMSHELDHVHHDHDHDHDNVSLASSLSSFSEDHDDASSSSSSSSSSSEPVFQMSSLMDHLPIKRGLSKHFQGKSQSFTSLANVKCLQDLVKPERKDKCFSCKRKKLKSSKSYGNGLDNYQKALSPKECSRTITKKSFSSKGSLASSMTYNNARRHGFPGNKPPVHTKRTGSFVCFH